MFCRLTEYNVYSPFSSDDPNPASPTLKHPHHYFERSTELGRGCCKSGFHYAKTGCNEHRSTPDPFVCLATISPAALPSMLHTLPATTIPRHDNQPAGDPLSGPAHLASPGPFCLPGVPDKRAEHIPPSQRSLGPPTAVSPKYGTVAQRNGAVSLTFRRYGPPVDVLSKFSF